MLPGTALPASVVSLGTFRERMSWENLLVLMVFSKVVQVWWPEGESLLTCCNLTYLEAFCL